MHLNQCLQSVYRYIRKFRVQVNFSNILETHRQDRNRFQCFFLFAKSSSFKLHSLWKVSLFHAEFILTQLGLTMLTLLHISHLLLVEIFASLKPGLGLIIDWTVNERTARASNYVLVYFNQSCNRLLRRFFVTNKTRMNPGKLSSDWSIKSRDLIPLSRDFIVNPFASPTSPYALTTPLSIQ